MQLFQELVSIYMGFSFNLKMGGKYNFNIIEILFFMLRGGVIKQMLLKINGSENLRGKIRKF